ncbi:MULTISPECIES: flavin reductase family protein [Kitasatospora]|uniref:Putative NADPH-flavin oxidoreductase n=1 Tax=Kitasatospora setae (strain ATCC 33774 / DSM 43861 / JCM 3304 / KCC A-0304 / NBRC 14216 / KM-6054) TaxID=452652 RepID=E4N6B2_KITSK|nr:flavin reductase family protein [Kitasatospora setae]BAJ26743.1 putative NADPH-flavin oxidoreductase [Kitasatospora setae KM-6054]
MTRPSGQAPAATPHAVSRRLTTGVSVLTSAHGGSVHAATASTVAVLSQQPLTLAVSLRRNSVLAELATLSGYFVVNVLTSRQAVLADWFAFPRRPRGRAQFGPVDWRTDTATGIPVLTDHLALLTCRIVGRTAVGADDDLIIAEVTAAEAGRGNPLVNYDGRLLDPEFNAVVRRPGWRPRAHEPVLD